MDPPLANVNKQKIDICRQIDFTFKETDYSLVLLDYLIATSSSRSADLTFSQQKILRATLHLAAWNTMINLKK